MKKIVLMYHDIGLDSGFQSPTAFKYKVSKELFENQISLINDLRRTKNLSPDFVEFTFDDGGISFYDCAAPILEKYGFKGVCFVTTSQIGKPGFLSEGQIKELHKRGHFIGSHSHSHPERMNNLSDQILNFEWEKSQSILESILGFKPSCASIPNGFSSHRVIEAMRSNGINHIYTSCPTSKIKYHEDCIIKGRFAIIDSDNAMAVKNIVTSSFIRGKKNLRFSALNLAKDILGESYLKIRKSLLK